MWTIVLNGTLNLLEPGYTDPILKGCAMRLQDIAALLVMSPACEWLLELMTCVKDRQTDRQTP